MKKPVPWDEIQIRYVSGEKSHDLADIYGVSASYIRKKSEREQWPTATNLRKRAKELNEQANRLDGVENEEIDLNKKLVEIWDKRRDEERDNIHVLLKKFLDKVDVNSLEVKSINDLVKLIEMHRKNLGLEEKGSSSDKQSLISVAVLGGGNAPKPIRDVTPVGSEED